MKIMRQSTLSMHITKHKSGARGLQRHNEREPGQKHSNPKIKPERTKDNIFLTEKDDLTYKERISKILREEYTGVRAVRKDAVKMCEITVQLGGDIAKHGTEEQQIEVLKQAFEELKETYGEKNVVSAVIHVDETTPHLHFDFVPLTKEGNLSAKKVVGGRGDMSRRQESFLHAMQERCDFAKFDRKPDGQFNGLDQKLFEAMTAKVREFENEVFEREDKLEDAEIALEERESKVTARENEVKAKEVAIVEQFNKFNEMAAAATKQMAERENALNYREMLLDNREASLYEREDVIDEREAEIDKKDLETRRRALRASESLREASEKLEEVKATESRIKMLLDEIKAHSVALVENVKETVKKWTGRVRRVQSEPLTEFFEERTDKLENDISVSMTQDDFIDLTLNDLSVYDDDMQEAYDDELTL